MKQQTITVAVFTILTGAAMTSPVRAGQTPGEFDIPSVNPLGSEQLEKLRHLAATDPEAKALAEQARKNAAELLDAKPHPLKVIHYEGLVNTDPRRIATVRKLREMGDVARLVRYWQVSADPNAAETLQRFILAWTGTYRLTGNDVNENKFRPLLVAYHALRPEFDPRDRRRVDPWVEELGKLHAEAVKKSRHFTNRYGKHVRLATLAGMILGRDEWLAVAREGVKRFVRKSLHKDGTSEDLQRRDTLTYHASALRPPIELAMLSGAKGRELYTWESPRGGSLKKSVDYVVPYALGKKTRREWKNTKVGLDRRRAEAGLDKYKPGKLYEPSQALELMEEASYFDPGLLKVVRHLTGNKAKRFPTWQTLINEACRPPEQSTTAPARPTVGR
ncbi:MAG: alginate lyase family protein [Phycisphaerae bacterium]